MPGLLTYETILTDADWQKKKGVVGKRKKTGIGEALTDLQKTVLKSGFTTLDTKPGRAVTADPDEHKRNRKLITDGLANQGKDITAKIKVAQTKIAAGKTAFAGDKKVIDHLDLMNRRLTELGKMVAPNSPLIAQASGVSDKAFVAGFATNQGVAFFIAEAPKLADRIKAVLTDLSKIKAYEASDAAPADRIGGIHEVWGKAGNNARSLSTNLVLWGGLAKAMPNYTQTIFSGDMVAKMRQEAPMVFLAGNEEANALSDVVNSNVDARTKRAAYPKFLNDFTGQMRALQKYYDIQMKVVKQLSKPATLIA